MEAAASLHGGACDLAALARSRRDAWLWFATRLLTPPGDADDLARTRDEWDELVRPLSPEEAERATLCLSSEGAAQVLAEEHARLLVVPTNAWLAPFESVYRGASLDGGVWQLGRRRGEAWAEVLQTYRRVGLVPPADAALDADHIAVELSFLGSLCATEADAWDRSDARAAGQAQSAARAFIGDHLRTFVTRLRQRCADCEGPGYVLALLRALERFVVVERAFLADQV